MLRKVLLLSLLMLSTVTVGCGPQGMYYTEEKVGTVKYVVIHNTDQGDVRLNMGDIGLDAEQKRRAFVGQPTSSTTSYVSVQSGKAEAKAANHKITSVTWDGKPVPSK